MKKVKSIFNLYVDDFNPLDSNSHGSTNRKQFAVYCSFNDFLPYCTYSKRNDVFIFMLAKREAREEKLKRLKLYDYLKRLLSDLHSILNIKSDFNTSVVILKDLGKEFCVHQVAEHHFEDF